MSSETHTRIREDVLRDPRYPLHRIADKLLPYLRVLLNQFNPEKVVVFGSFAYGNPDEHSDVDLLIIKPIQQSRIKDKVAIRSAWWPLLLASPPISFDLMLADPEENMRLSREKNSFHAEIIHKGLQVI